MKKHNSFFRQKQRRKTPPIVYSAVFVEAEADRYIPLDSVEERKGRLIINIEIANKGGTAKVRELAMYDTGSDISFYREEFFDPGELGYKTKSTKLTMKGISGFTEWKTEYFDATVKFGDYVFDLRFHALSEERFPSTQLQADGLVKFMVGGDFQKRAGIVHVQQAKTMDGEGMKGGKK